MSLEADIWSTTLRAMAQQAVLAGLVRTHPDPQRLRDVIEQFAEGNRTALLNSHATDTQLQTFEQALQTLVNTLPPPSAKA